MMAAVLAKGKTIISNAAKEPAIVDMQNYLNKIVPKISGAGTDIITITGVEKLDSTEHTVIPDRIETGTFITAAAITRGNIKIENVNLRHMDAVVAKFREMGVKIIEEQGELGLSVPII